MKSFGASAVLTVIFVFLKCIPSMECAIQCYKCLVAPPPFYTNETIRLCQDFDHSDKFIVDCPYSTFCMKKITSAKIPVPINGIERDCASQKMETQNYYDHKWHAEVTIEEPYQEGCAKVNDKGARTSTIEYCYCKGYLCNTSSRTDSAKFVSAISVIVLLLRSFSSI